MVEMCVVLVLMLLCFCLSVDCMYKVWWKLEFILCLESGIWLNVELLFWWV